MRAALVILLTVVALIAGCALVVKYAAGPNTFDEARANQQRRDEALRLASFEIAKTFDAVTDWREGRLQFTAQLKEALIRSDDRPVFFRGRVRDIDSAEGSYVVTFDVGDWGAGVDLRFRLLCNAPAVVEELGSPSGAEFVGVASISEVRMTQDSPGPIVMGPQRRFLASGYCQHLRRLDY